MDRFLSRLKPIRCTKFIAFFKIVVSPRKVSKGKRGNHDFKHGLVLTGEETILLFFMFLLNLFPPYPPLPADAMDLFYVGRFLSLSQ